MRNKMPEAKIIRWDFETDNLFVKDKLYGVIKYEENTSSFHVINEKGYI